MNVVTASSRSSASIEPWLSRYVAWNSCSPRPRSGSSCSADSIEDHPSRERPRRQTADCTLSTRRGDRQRPQGRSAEQAARNPAAPRDPAGAPGCAGTCSPPTLRTTSSTSFGIHESLGVSGDDAMASTTSRTVIRPLLSWRTQLELAASGCRSSIWRYSSFTTCCASVVQGCCAATDEGKNRAQVSIAAARYIHTSPFLPFHSCASGLVPSGRAVPLRSDSISAGS